MANGLDDRFFRCPEGFLHVGQPHEFTLRAEKGLEWCHYVAKLGVFGHLIDKAEPASDSCGGGWGWEVPDGVKVFREQFYCSVGDPEAGEVHFSLSELELVGV